MHFTNQRKLTLTLFCTLALAFALAGSTSADDLVHRRDHMNLNRMIKKRIPADDPLDSIFNPAPNPPGDDSDSVSSFNGATSTQSASTSASAAASTSESPSSAASTSSETSASTTSSLASSSSSSALSSVASMSTSLSSSSSASSTSTSTSTTPTSAIAQTTSSPPAVETTPTVTSASDGAVDTVFSVSHLPSATAASANNSDTSPKGATALSHTALTVIIVLASCIGGGAILWTIIRKWKLRKSSRFEDRLDPIDWQPTDPDNGLPGQARRISNASSFQSSAHENGLARNNSVGAYGATANDGLVPLPDHDFTAGPSTLAPVGDYADLARGPSPQPQMQEALSRGPSFTRNYDYGVPLHHQGGYNAQDAYNYNGARY